MTQQQKVSSILKYLHMLDAFLFPPSDREQEGRVQAIP